MANNINDFSNNSLSSITKNLLTSKKSKIICAAILLMFIVVGIFVFNANKLSYEEKWALHNVEKYQSMLKDPDSMVLRGDILILWYWDDDAEAGDKMKQYTYFIASGNNSFGASIQSMPCFKGYIYLADLDDYKEDDFDTTEDYIEMLKADVAFKRYKAVGVSKDGNSSVFRAEIISGKKIARKLHIDYKEN